MMIDVRHKSQASFSANRAVIVGLSAMAFVALAGCASIEPFDTGLDPSSPAATHVNQVAAADLPYPRWSKFPGAPQDVPSMADFAARIANLEVEHARVLDEAAHIQWSLANTEAWADKGRAQIDPRMAVQAPADQEARTAAFAKAAKDLATPPPPAK